MAFNTNTPRASYIATAGQTVFPFTFKIFTNTNITVYKNQVALVLSTDYTVIINGDSGGSITLLVGASLNDEIVLVRSLPIIREFDYQDNGDFFASTVDNDQDYQTYLVQDADAKFIRTFKLPDAISGKVSSALPLPVNDAYIRWNSDGTAIINDTTIPSAVTQAEDARDIAVTKAGEASTSASQALGYRNEAEVFRDESEASALSVDSANLVHKTGDETIADIKTFSSSPVVPTPTTGDQVANKDYVDDKTLIQPNDSRVKTALNATGEAPIYACRAWVNFNGTGTVAIRASGNISSITDNDIGTYTANFTTAMQDVGYSYSAIAPYFLINVSYGNTLSSATKSIDNISLVFRSGNNGALYDSDNCSVIIFR